MVSVGIVGGSGYMGGEALRVLLRHPHAEVAWATSRSPGPVEQVHPNLYDTGLHFVRLEEVKTPGFVVLALPTGASMAAAALRHSLRPTMGRRRCLAVTPTIPSRATVLAASGSGYCEPQ